MTLQDARRSRIALNSTKNVVITAAVLMGLELASTARSLGKNVNVLEHMPRVLGRSVSPLVSDYIAGDSP